VLVVDDEPTLVDLQKEILEGLGAVVVGAASGREAIEQLRQRTFDVIVTDLRMPGGVSGQDLFRWVESNAPESAGRLFSSRATTPGTGRDFIDSIGARCVMKPFSMDDYVRTLPGDLR
jgi:CheY-like chemotaxis protein